MIASSTDFFKKNIEEVFEALEKCVHSELSTADENNSVEIKILPGLCIKSEYKPAAIGTNPATQNKINIPPHLLVKTKISETFKERVNEKTFRSL